MDRFVPRRIDLEQAAHGFNNEGRGKFLGCIADVAQHEKSCAYRKNPKRTPVVGEPNAYTGATCDCRIGLWQEEPPAVKVVNEMRKTAKRAPKKAKAKPRRAKAKNSKR